MAVTVELKDRWSDMLFGIRRSIRYHQRRRGFYDKLDKFSNMLSLIFGSATIYGVLDSNAKVLALISSAIVTVFASINLVIGSAQRGRDHTDYMRKYVELEKRMLASPTEELLLEITAARLTIEAEEPPVLHVLNSICHNELARAMGYSKRYYTQISMTQTLFSQLFDYRESTLRPVEVEKKKSPDPTP